MNVRPFRLLTASAMGEIEQRCQEAVRHWAQDWLPQGGALAGLSLAAHEASGVAGAPGEPGLLLQQGRRGFLWAPASALDAMARALFETSEVEPNGVLMDVVHTALEALLKRLLGQGGAAGEVTSPMLRRPLPAGHALPGSAIVDLTLTMGPHRIVLVHEPAEHDRARPRAAAETARHALTTAMAGQAVTVRVELDDVEIDLRSLYALARGDVIQLGTKLDGTVRLRIEEQAGPAALQGYLGVAGRHRAIELAAPSEAAP